MRQTKEERSIVQKKWKEKNKESIKIKRRIYYEKNKDKINKYRIKNKDKINKNRRKNRPITKINEMKYMTENRELIKLRRKKYYEENKEEIKFKCRMRYRKNKDKMKKYREKNKDRAQAYYNATKTERCVICGGPASIKYCSRECSVKGCVGKNNSQWKGGKSPYPNTWTEKFKRQIRKRDAYLCMMCNRHQDEFNRSHDVHHIDGDKMNTTKKNCITLCARHHTIVEHGGKKHTFWMPKFQKMLSKLYGYNYSPEKK